MGKDLNKVQLTGHLGADPEMRYTAQGAAVTTFRVASNRQWTDAGGTRREEAEWFRVVAWNKLGEICNEYLTKGTRVYVEGRLQSRKYTDRDGIERYVVEVIAQDMIILSGRGERGPDLTDADAPDADGEVFPDEPPPALPPPAPRAPAPAAPAPARAPARAQGRTSAPNAPRQPARNVPQPIESDDDIPF